MEANTKMLDFFKQFISSILSIIQVLSKDGSLTDAMEMIKNLLSGKTEEADA